MHPKCQCPCGANLELRHARGRDKVAEDGNWSKWRLRFRCPRCGREVVREFDSRVERNEPQVLEIYERSEAAELGPIGPREEHELWAAANPLKDLIR